MEGEAVPPAEGWCHSLTDKGEYGKFSLCHMPLVTKLLTAANMSSQRCNYAACQLWIHWCHVTEIG